MALFLAMNATMLSSGSLQGFRRSDLEHDRRFLFEAWKGEALLWAPYDCGTHLIRLIATANRRRAVIIDAIKTVRGDFEGVLLFLVEPPSFALQAISRDALEDEATALLEPESGRSVRPGAAAR